MERTGLPFFKKMRMPLLSVCLVIMLGLAASAPISAQEYEDQKLMAADGQEGDYFGKSVAQNDEFAMVGAYWADSYLGQDTGKVYVYRYDAGTDQWIEHSQLVPAGIPEYSGFGRVLTIQGDLALIAAPYEGDDVGAAYVYRYDLGTDTWNEDVRLAAAEGVEWSAFGRCVAYSNDIAVFGAPYYRNSSDMEVGAAYVFRYDSGAGLWIEESILLASDGEEYDDFGYSVGLTQDMVIVGSKDNTNVNGNDAGSAYVFRYDVGTGAWIEESKIIPSDGMEDQSFGYSMDVEQDMALIGARDSDEVGGDRSGAAYLFRYDSGTGLWSEEHKFFLTDGLQDDNFGYAVSLDGDRALVGMGKELPGPERALLYEYDAGTGTWEQLLELHATDNVQDDAFGSAVSILGDRALIGARRADGMSQECGVAYHYNLIFPYTIDIKANGQDDLLVVSSFQNLNVSAEYEAGSFEGMDVDIWFIVHFDFLDLWGSYGYHTPFPSWQLNPSNVYFTGGLPDGTVTLWDQPMMVPGLVHFYAALDDNDNGSLLDSNILTYDMVSIIVLP